MLSPNRAVPPLQVSRIRGIDIPARFRNSQGALSISGTIICPHAQSMNSAIAPVAPVLGAAPYSAYQHRLVRLGRERE